MNDAIFSLIVLASSLFAGLFISTVISFLIGRWSKSGFGEKFKLKLVHLRTPLFSLIPALCCLLTSPFLRLAEEQQAVFSRGINLWLIASFGWLLVKVVTMLREAVLDRHDFTARDNLEARKVYTQTRVISHVLTVGIILLTAAFMLMTFPKVRQIGVSLLASAGIIGIVLGLAAQKTLGNLIAGIQIAMAQPIRLDDAVVVENEWGWIEEITLTYVVVRIWDLRRLILPISYFIEKPFQNWTRNSADILGSVFLYVDYTVPVEKIRAELTKLLEKSPYWDKKVNCLQVTNASERTVELRALMSATDSPTAWNLRCEIREKMLDYLQKNYPQSLPRTRVDLQK